MTIVCVLAACGAVVWITWPAQAPETPAPEQRQVDQSLILERRPEAAPKPKQQIPRGAKIERVVQITVQPDTPAPEAGAPCPPVTVDMTLVKEEGGTRRVIASSPDGRVVGGLDVPVEPIAIPPQPRRWAAGLSWAQNQTYGVWVERDIEIPLTRLAARVGFDLNQTRVQTSAPGVEGRVRIGFAF